MISLGYPGDRNKKFEEFEEDETALTYTCGSPVGTQGIGISSSLYISGGATVIPILGKLGQDVFGILSHRLGVNEGQGMPGIFRPNNSGNIKSR